MSVATAWSRFCLGRGHKTGIALDQTESHYTAGPFGDKGDDWYDFEIPAGFEVASVELVKLEKYAADCRLVAPPPQGTIGQQRLQVHWWYNGFGKIRYRVIVHSRRRAEDQPARASVTLTDFHWVRDVEPDQTEEPYLVIVPFVVDARTVALGAYAKACIGSHGNIGYDWEAGETRPIPNYVGAFRADAEPIQGRVLMGVMVCVADEDFTPAETIAAQINLARRGLNEALAAIVSARLSSSAPVAGPLSALETEHLTAVARHLSDALTAPESSWNPDDLVGTVVRAWSVDSDSGVHLRDELRLDGPGGACTIGVVVDAVDQSASEGAFELFARAGFQGARRTAPLQLFEPERLHPWRFGLDGVSPQAVRWSLHPCSTVLLYGDEAASTLVREISSSGEIADLVSVGVGPLSTWKWFDTYIPIRPQRQQNESWCWAAVTAALAGHYFPEKALTQCQIATLTLANHGWDCCANPRSCQRTLDITHPLKAAGLESEVFDGAPSAADIKGWLRENQAAVPVITWFEDDERKQHFLIVLGIDAEDNVWVGDSSGGSTEVMPLLDAINYGVGEWTSTLVVRGPDREPTDRWRLNAVARRRGVGPRDVYRSSEDGAGPTLIYPHRVSHMPRLRWPPPSEVDAELWQAFPRDGPRELSVIGPRAKGGAIVRRRRAYGLRIAATRDAIENGNVPRNAHVLHALLDGVAVLAWDGESGRHAWVLDPAPEGLPTEVVVPFDEVVSRLGRIRRTAQ